MRSLIRSILPYGVVKWRHEQSARRAREARSEYHAGRRQELERHAAYRANDASQQQETSFQYGSAIGVLTDLGLDEDVVLRSTIPEASLAFSFAMLEENLDLTDRHCALHVGNFVGVSLCALAAFLRDRNDQSLVVGIDPNLTYCGVVAPHRYVVQLAKTFDLLGNIMPVAAFSHDRNYMDRENANPDRLDTDNPYDDVAFERGLESLKAMSGPERFGIALMDGHHEADYLDEELALIRPLLSDGALVILDDVNDAWEDLKALYEGLDERQWEDLGTDGRLGVLRKVRHLED